MKQTLRALLCALLLITLGLSTSAEYIGSAPEDGIYLIETEKHTCTLIACTMMLREHSYRADSIYEHVDEDVVRAYGWTKTGLLWDFSIGGVSVTCLHEISRSRDKKAYLIDLLRKHPEGCVIYDANAPHAIWLFGYDETTDTFYCADTATDVAGRTIPLSSSILKGRTQEEKIARLDRVWVVAGEYEALSA